MKDLKYEHQSIKMGGGGVGGGFMGGWLCGGGMGCWRVHGVGANTHPPMNSYNVKISNFMNTHPPIKHIQCHSVTIHILWRAHGVGGGGVVGGFIGWWLGVHGVGGWRVHGVGWCVVVGCMVGWVVGEFMGG